VDSPPESLEPLDELLPEELLEELPELPEEPPEVLVEELPAEELPELVEELPELVEELPELVDEPLELVAALLEPGRAKATAPAAATLTAAAVAVVTVSRRRPRSRWATASAVRRAAACPSLLFMPLSLARLAARPPGRTSELLLRPRPSERAGQARPNGQVPPGFRPRGQTASI
jgi:hypothetical protein